MTSDPATPPDLILRFLAIMTDPEDGGSALNDSVWWRSAEDGIKILLDCSDTFSWACADAEEILSVEDIELLEQCREDLLAAGEGCIDYIVLLYCARKRQMRPQGALYKNLTNPALVALIDAAGPEREVNMWNPIARISGEHE